MHSGRMGTEGYVDRGLDPAGAISAGAMCELPCLFGGTSHSDDAFNLCPDVRVHQLT